MATTKTNIRRQVDRLVSLAAQQTEAFGVDPQTVRNDLGRALERYARSDEDALAIVDWLIFERAPEERSFRPAPGEIGDAARFVHEAQERAAKPDDRPPCPECGGTRWLSREVQRFDPISQQAITVSGAVPCNCRSAKGAA